eukprot:Rhum_TRINITY_DN11543_c1_g1::Rhum_TRINITY_DN11543_c1_g1_i1::g.45171::m.45171
MVGVGTTVLFLRFFCFFFVFFAFVQFFFVFSLLLLESAATFLIFFWSFHAAAVGFLCPVLRPLRPADAAVGAANPPLTPLRLGAADAPTFGLRGGACDPLSPLSRLPGGAADDDAADGDGDAAAAFAPFDALRRAD